MMTRQARAALDCLQAEAEAIKSGNYPALDALQAQSAAALAALERTRPAASDLKRIKAALQSNQTLLQAAIRGIGAAQARLAALSEVQSGLSTYDPKGHRATVRQPQGNIEKKA